MIQLTERQLELRKRILPNINSEIKCIELAYLLNGIPRTEADLHASYIRLVGSDVWVPSSAAFGNYCRRTMKDSGLVIALGNGFLITPFGDQYAKPAAIISINNAIKLDKSMAKVLGHTTSKTSAAPTTRYAILEILEDKKPDENIRLTDLVNELTDAYKMRTSHNVVSGNLDALKAHGFVTYDSVGPNVSGWAEYVWTGGNRRPEEVGSHKGFIHLLETARYCKEIGKATRDEISHHAGISVEHASHNLALLNRLGFCTATRWKGREKMSEIAITDKGREFYQSFVAPISLLFSDSYPDIAGLLNSGVDIPLAASIAADASKHPNGNGASNGARR